MNISDIIVICAYFVIYSFFGWILESVYKSVREKKIINSGFLYGPFCAIYGFGALMMYLFLNNFKDNIAILFFVGIIILSFWEYIVGALLEKMFNTKYWDYSNEKYNFQGRICLQSSLYWGILGVLFTTIIHPIIEKAISLIPINIVVYITAPILIYILIDTIVSMIKVKNIEIKIGKIKEIDEKIKLKLEELKNLKVTSKKRSTVNQIITELKHKEETLKLQISKQTNRLRKAFPSMKSEKISEFLNQRIEILKSDKHNKK